MSFDTLDAPAGILVRGAGCGPGVSVILRSDATKDLISLARSWLLKRDIRSFASLRMTIGLRVPHPYPASRLLGCRRGRRRRLLGVRRRRGAARRTRQRNLGLRLVRRPGRVGDRSNLLCTLNGTLDARAVDRGLVLRLQHNRERLWHRHWLRLAAEDSIDIRLDAVRGQPLTLRRGLGAVRQRLRIDAELLPEHRDELRELGVELRLVFRAERNLGAVCLLQHDLALRDG